MAWSISKLCTSYATKNFQGGVSGEDVVSDGRIVEPWKVNVVKLLLSKLDPKCPRLFQRHFKHFNEENDVWYTGQPIGKNTIKGFMKDISVKAKLSQVYINHSVCASTVTHLIEKNVNTTAIMRTTGHRCSDSLKAYAAPNEQQK